MLAKARSGLCFKAKFGAKSSNFDLKKRKKPGNLIYLRLYLA